MAANPYEDPLLSTVLQSAKRAVIAKLSPETWGKYNAWLGLEVLRDVIPKHNLTWTRGVKSRLRKTDPLTKAIDPDLLLIPSNSVALNVAKVRRRFLREVKAASVDIQEDVLLFHFLLPAIWIQAGGDWEPGTELLARRLHHESRRMGLPNGDSLDLQLPLRLISDTKAGILSPEKPGHFRMSLNSIAAVEDIAFGVFYLDE